MLPLLPHSGINGRLLLRLGLPLVVWDQALFSGDARQRLFVQERRGVEQFMISFQRALLRHDYFRLACPVSFTSLPIPNSTIITLQPSARLEYNALGCDTYATVHVCPECRQYSAYTTCVYIYIADEAHIHHHCKSIFTLSQCRYTWHWDGQVLHSTPGGFSRNE